MEALQQQTRQGDQVGKVHFNSYFRNVKILIPTDRLFYRDQFYRNIDRKPANATTVPRFVCHGLTSGENYVFRVKAVNAAGYSPSSPDSEAVLVKAAVCKPLRISITIFRCASNPPVSLCALVHLFIHDRPYSAKFPSSTLSFGHNVISLCLNLSLHLNLLVKRSSTS